MRKSFLPYQYLGVLIMKGAYGDPENTGVGYNTIITELGDHSVPKNWEQFVAKRDAGIPMSQHPQKITHKPLENKGKKMRDKYDMPINSREYHFDGANGEAIIQEHSLGHPQFGGEAAMPHFNVRSITNPRTGTYPNTKGHYVFSKKNK